jgi:mannosyl-oligosaccharide alpha-1,2-mannosidase
MNTFLKEHLILGGAVDQYRGLYEKTIAAAKKHLFFRPLVPDYLKDSILPALLEA